jgi:radical SAM superfamily enzyme YgiQ (UPF0313 family)
MSEKPHCDNLIGERGFSNKPMIPPPSERGPRVVQFELTNGCSHGRCTFCDMYGGPSSYSEKSLPEYKKHVNSVLKYFPKDFPLNKIFIGAGNALNVETDKLIDSLNYSLESFKSRFNHLPKRISIYGNTQNILKQNFEGMRALKNTLGYHPFRESGRGIDVVYWGIESGSDEVLKVAGKGYIHNQACRAGRILQESDIQASVMIMPGLGGMKYFKDHVERTAELLNYCQPNWITFMGLKIKEGTPYKTWMEKQKETESNRDLTPKETAEQTAQIIERLRFRTTVGIHGERIHDDLCFNPIVFGSVKIGEINSAKDLSGSIRMEIKEKFKEKSTKKTIFDFLKIFTK